MQPTIDTFNIKIHNCNSVGDNRPCKTLSPAGIIKYLGVHLDSILSWSKQLEVLISRVRKLMTIFTKLRNSADLSTLRMVHFSLAQSILAYCTPAWRGACASHFLKLERAELCLKL